MPFSDIQPETISKQIMTRGDLEPLFERNLAKINTANDGKISRDEINRAFQDASFIDKDAEFVALVEEEFPRLANMTYKWPWEKFAVTRDDIRTFNKIRDGKGDTNEKVWWILSGKAADADHIDTILVLNDVRALTCYPGLYAPLAQPIKPEFVNQTDLGNCWVLAPEAAQAQADPKVIADSIKENKDGSCIVTFRGAPNEHYLVPKLTQAETLAYAGGSKGGKWPGVIEYAYGQYLQRHDRDPSLIGTIVNYACKPIETIKQKLGRLPYQDIVQREAGIGGDPDEFAQLLSGRKMNDQYIQRDIWLQAGQQNLWMRLPLPLASIDEVDKTLSKACREHGAIVAGTLMPWFSHLKEGILPGHVYSVLGYDSQTKMVTLKNPWGHEEPQDIWGSPLDGNDDGIFKLSLAGFRDNFQFVDYATNDKGFDYSKIANTFINLHNVRRDIDKILS